MEHRALEGENPVGGPETLPPRRMRVGRGLTPLIPRIFLVWRGEI